MAEIQNNDVSEMGAKAVQLWKQGDKGDAIATFCLWVAHNTVTFQTTIKGGKNETDTVLTFDLNEANRHSTGYRDIHNENGSRNIKHVNARTLEIASRIFGLTEPTVAQKQRIDRALEIVAGFERRELAFESITLSSRNELQVPYVLMNKAPDPDKASSGEMKKWELYRDENVPLDGKGGQSLAALKRNLSPERTKGAAPNKTDRGVAFVASVIMLNQVMAARNDETGENHRADDIPAFNGSIKENLWRLYSHLGTYFEADPMSDVNEVPFDKASNQ